MNSVFRMAKRLYSTMEQKYLSVKQLAGEIGTNKLMIHRAINKLGLQGKLHKAGNRYMLSESQAKQIKSIILGENVSEIVSSTPKIFTAKTALFPVILHTFTTPKTADTPMLTREGN